MDRDGEGEIDRRKAQRQAGLGAALRPGGSTREVDRGDGGDGPPPGPAPVRVHGHHLARRRGVRPGRLLSLGEGRRARWRVGGGYVVCVCARACVRVC